MIHRAFLERSCYGIKVRQVSEYIIVITGMLWVDAAIVNNQLFHHVCTDVREVSWLQCTLSWHLFCIRKLQNHKKQSGKIKIHCTVWACFWPDYVQLILELDQVSAMSDLVWMTGQLLQTFVLISDISPIVRTSYSWRIATSQLPTVSAFFSHCSCVRWQREPLEAGELWQHQLPSWMFPPPPVIFTCLVAS